MNRVNRIPAMLVVVPAILIVTGIIASKTNSVTPFLALAVIAAFVFIVQSIRNRR